MILQQVFDHMSPGFKTALDWLALLTALGNALTAFLPIIAAVPPFVWGCIRIYDWWEQRKKKDK